MPSVIMYTLHDAKYFLTFFFLLLFSNSLVTCSNCNRLTNCFYEGHVTILDIQYGQ